MRESGSGPSLGLQLIIERTFLAPRDRIFRAWIDPVLMGRWFAPVGMKPVGIESQPHVGGKFILGMQEPDGTTHYAAGQYLEIKSPTRIVFTWSWLSDPGQKISPQDDSVVTVEFYDQGDSTRVVLKHERLADETSREGHRQGWIGCFEHLEMKLSIGEI